MREMVVGQVAKQILLPVDWATAAVTGCLPYPLDQMERLPDFVEFSSQYVASLASSMVSPLIWATQLEGGNVGKATGAALSISQSLLHFSVDKLLVQGETFGLQYGPMAYGLIFQEIDHWAA